MSNKLRATPRMPSPTALARYDDEIRDEQLPADDRMLDARARYYVHEINKALRLEARQAGVNSELVGCNLSVIDEDQGSTLGKLYKAKIQYANASVAGHLIYGEIRLSALIAELNDKCLTHFPIRNADTQLERIRKSVAAEKLSEKAKSP